jgi:hypothetical protein
MRGSVSAGFFFAADPAMTKTDIANLALSKIGESLIDDITDSGDRRARLALLHYEPALREILRAHFWLFAMAVLPLSAREFRVYFPAAWPAPTAVQFITVGGNPTVSGQPVTFETLIYAGEYNGRPKYTNTGNQIDYTQSLMWIPYSAGWVLIRYDSVNSINREWTAVQNVASPDLITNPFVGFSPAAGTPTVALVDYPSAFAGQWVRHGDAAPYAWYQSDSAGEWQAKDAFRNPAHPGMLGWEKAWTSPGLVKTKMVRDENGGKIEKFDLRRVDGATLILTDDYDAASIEGVEFLDDPDAYDPLFVTAFSTLLAARLARAITGSEKAESDLLSLYHNVDLPAARTADGHDSQSNENHPLAELVDGSLTGTRGSFFPVDDE